eukprot:CAMPEP_0194508888 /NCGR_PEP_ID=MMETSP0253-20130528/39182_1 /TAXON_ID=2966 /ORGANISM="Noctiluca scintillans" /LENGTH=99 /DNA_ID=CAMNT_0039351961 /DNA_START=217 /DNA_END=514 /DNA_ORIENTATION=+
MKGQLPLHKNGQRRPETKTRHAQRWKRSAELPRLLGQEFSPLRVFAQGSYATNMDLECVGAAVVGAVVVGAAVDGGAVVGAAVVGAVVVGAAVDGAAVV